MYTIYKYTNIHNGKVYIGQTCKTLAERALANGINYRECRRFYNAIKKYGWNSFVPEILEITETAESANILEVRYIKEYNSTNDKFGYNIAVGGDNKEMSQETRDIISAKAKERYKDKTANPMYGKHHSKEALKKQSECKMGDKNPMYGRKWTERQREMCSTKGKKLNLSDGQREALREKAAKMGELRKRKVLCVEDNKYFDSLTDAANYYGVSVSTLCGQITGRQHTCKGMHFEYVS